MIFDAENTFFWKKALSGTSVVSDIIKTGPGDAVNPLGLYVKVDKASADVTVTLKTSAKEDFSGPVTLGTYALKKDSVIKVKLPYGDLGYLRLDVTAGAALTAGNISAALVMDMDLK